MRRRRPPPPLALGLSARRELIFCCVGWRALFSFLQPRGAIRNKRRAGRMQWRGRCPNGQVRVRGCGFKRLSRSCSRSTIVRPPGITLLITLTGPVSISRIVQFVALCCKPRAAPVIRRWLDRLGSGLTWLCSLRLLQECRHSPPERSPCHLDEFAGDSISPRGLLGPRLRLGKAVPVHRADPQLVVPGPHDFQRYCPGGDTVTQRPVRRLAGLGSKPRFPSGKCRRASGQSSRRAAGR